MPTATLPDQHWIDDVGPVPGLRIRSWDLTSPLAHPEDVGVVVQPYFTAADRLRQLAGLPDLQAVQLLTAGYDSAVPYLPAGVRLANAAGVHDASTAEHAVALTLAALRGIPAFVQAQQRSEWLPLRIRPSLADRRVLIVGYGQIGQAIAARLAPFEVDLTAVASRARQGDDLVGPIAGIDELPSLLPHYDVVILIVPLTEATTGLVDDAFLAAMPDGALLVNVARGGVVDTDALVRATSSGRIQAALDVTDPEPLRSEHPLWRAPGVLISPHVGGATSAFRPRAIRLLRAQLRRYAAGEPLANVVATG
ncbi:MAG TPA: 2-hydroxyacid dehydrogenase [Dermatophilaceae bacterium]|nr:2-hydroxyacid dehydrogenase [Dermatophilaceae bacterium]